MYIIKNAFRCIGRSKGRNILIAIITLVIAIAACIGLSIRQAAENAKESALDGMSVTASISYDRASAMGDMAGGRPGMGGGGFSGGGFDPSQLGDIMGNSSSLTLEEYQKYANAESVEDFYYTMTAYFNGSENFAPVSDETDDETGETEGTETDDETGETEGTETDEAFPGGFPGGIGGMNFSFGVSGDFSVIGYSSYRSMTSFVNDNSSIVEGTMFDEGTSELVCVISEELAMFNNNLAVGDTITITNPSLEDEIYTLTIKGIYSSSENNDFSMSKFSTSQDPANHIYVSANTLQKILEDSEANSTTVTDSNNITKESKITATLDATYSFANADDYYAFEEEVRNLGLDDSYTVESTDITAFENSIAPLNTLSKMAGWFLLVILIIGGIILVVLNIFNVRERKYEVGVLTAMGMKKWKVAAQFMCEILVVTMLAVIIGTGIGAISALPVTNALLEGQIENQSNQQDKLDENFGRPVDMGNDFPGGSMPGMTGGRPSDMPNNDFDGNMFDGAANYITEVNSAMNLTVVFQMIAVGLLLTLIASAASVLFIMRYDPLKILANRD